MEIDPITTVPPSASVGAALEYARCYAGLPQAELARHLNLDQSHIAHIAAGRHACAPDLITAWLNTCERELTSMPWQPAATAVRDLVSLAAEKSQLTTNPDRVIRPTEVPRLGITMSDVLADLLAADGAHVEEHSYSEWPRRLWNTAALLIFAWRHQGILDAQLLRMVVGDDNLPKLFIQSLRHGASVMRLEIGGLWWALRSAALEGSVGIPALTTVLEPIAAIVSESPYLEQLAAVRSRVEELCAAIAAAHKAEAAANEAFLAEQADDDIAMREAAAHGEADWRRLVGAWSRLAADDQKTLADLAERLAQSPKLG